MDNKIKTEINNIKINIIGHCHLSNSQVSQING